MKVYEVKLTYSIVREDGPGLPECNRPELVADYMKDAFDPNPEIESFWVIMLNRKNRARSRQLITLGTATSSLAHPREVFRAAVMASATGIICVHNHPSGDPAPSAADVQVTRQLREAAKALDIDLLDHVICGCRESDPVVRGFYSFREAGII